MKLHWISGLLALLSVTVAAGGNSALQPIPNAPDLRKLDWKPGDEFCSTRVENGKTILTVEVPADKAQGGHWFSAPIDLTAFRGRTVTLRVRYRTTRVSEPPKRYFGSKFMLSYLSGNDGRRQWPDAGLPQGTSDGWAEGAIRTEFPPGATDGELVLGLQNVSGKIEFELDSLEAGTLFAPDQRINLDYQVNYPEKIRNHPRLRGFMIPGKPLGEAGYRQLRDWNVNLGRAQIIRNWGKVGTDLDLDDYDRWLERRLSEIEADAAIARKYGVKLVIDLHSPPGGRLSANDMRMFHDKKYADAFIRSWRMIAKRFRSNPSIFAYDLVNEPLQSLPAPYDYWNLQRLAAEAVREIDPDTPIMIESNESDRPQSFRYLSPLRMDNIIYKVHMYMPISYTHQRHQGGGEIIAYPGMIEGEQWDKAKIRETLQPVRDFQLRHNARIYVGEFSAIIWAPGAEKYLADCIDLFEEYGWDWTYHAFREWDGWSLEHEGEGPGKIRKSGDNPRKRLLLEAFRKNRE